MFGVIQDQISSERLSLVDGKLCKFAVSPPHATPRAYVIYAYYALPRDDLIYMPLIILEGWQPLPFASYSQLFKEAAYECM